MEKQKFKVGDIVRIESDLSKYKGRTGTVVKYAGSRRRNLVCFPVLWLHGHC